MEIIPAGRPTKRAPESYFTGVVWQDPIWDAPEPGRVNSIRVSFEPGARTNWHTHPYGQTLHVLSGVGRAQSRGGPVREIRAGDTVWFAPGEEHWHGAGPETGMEHLAIQEREGASAATWLEPVSDADYLAAPER